MAKKKKIRADFRKNRDTRRTRHPIGRVASPLTIRRSTRLPRDERISGKGELTRKRTVIGDDAATTRPARVLLDVDATSAAGTRAQRAWPDEHGASG